MTKSITDNSLHMLKKLLLFVVLISSTCYVESLHAQALEYRQGEVIMCFHPGVDQQAVINRNVKFRGEETSFQMKKCLSDHMNIWVAKFDFTRIHEIEFINNLTSDPDILVAQQNHFIKQRAVSPNDPLLEQQWQWINLGSNGKEDADIDADDAWSITKGGVTVHGDTIVVAIIDVGVDDQHEDLIDNIWRNPHEIPNNGIDDDENGYVDDTRGWNILLEDDNVDPEMFAGGVSETHGTEILGVVGATGNNSIGIAGVNWNIKMMNVFFNSDLNEADMIAAYGYILQQRKMYNETNGERGAFVVATNLSYGDEELTPEETPIWCAVYDSLGAQGILNTAATANTEINIDTILDVPTSCASDYMIAVTATDEADERTFAAFGKRDIDLAAPGDLVYTTSIPGYAWVTGTSFAAPIVAGAVGLLYASPCGDLASLALTDPAAAALTARQLILENVDALPNLADEVSTGGRLNVFNALQATLTACTSCIAAFDITEDVGVNEATISWTTVDSVTGSTFQYRLMGDTNWIALDVADNTFSLSDLGVCMTYQYQIITSCEDGSQQSTEILSFTTGNCCMPPAFVNHTVLSETEVALEWDSVGAALNYLLLLAVDTDTLRWDSLEVSDNSISLDSLEPCTEYLLQVVSLCSDGVVEASDSISFRTFGCGPCLDSTYCIPPVGNSSEEWIQRIKLNTIENNSGPDNGYGNHTGNATTLKKGTTYTMEIEGGTTLDSLFHAYAAWIDYDQDGVFAEEDELIYSSDSAISDAVIEARIAIPEDVAEGLTRMRIIMLYDPISTVTPCETLIDLGEVEDYCVNIVFDSLLCPPPENLDTSNYTGLSTDVVWDPVDSAIAYVIRHRKLGEDWTEVVDTMPLLPLEMEECAMYEVQVKAVCPRDTSTFTESLIVEAFCMTSSNDLALQSRVITYPNPFKDQMVIRMDLPSQSEGRITISDLTGRILKEQMIHLSGGQSEIVMQDLSSLSSGIYMMAVETEHGRAIKKIMKY